MLISNAELMSRYSYIFSDMMGSVINLAEMNMIGADRNVETTIPVAIWW